MAELTYPEVGGTLAPALPGGYHHVDVRRLAGGPDALDVVAEVILDWGLQRGAGLKVPTTEPVAEGLEVELRLGPLRVPVRVVRVVDEPDRRGFVYGTLPGHPERGEEAFLAERDGEGTWIHIRAFSEPARWYSRLGGPVSRLVQRRFTERYVSAATRAAQE